MNRKQARMLSRMRVSKRERKHWMRLPGSVKGQLRRFYDDFEPMCYPDYLTALRAIGYKRREND